MNHEKREKIIFKKESYAIQGAIFEVYKEMGPGFIEAVYQECLEKEFDSKNIPYESQANVGLHYKNTALIHTYKADFICFDSILIELKAVKEITDIHRAQLLNYLNATKLKLGLLVNFSSYPKVYIERILL